MSDDFDAKVFRLYDPDCAAQKASVCKPSKKAATVTVATQLTLLIICAVGVGTLLYFSLERDKEVHALQTELKSMRTDITKLIGASNIICTEEINAEPERPSDINKPFSDTILAMARDLKQINETILSYNTDAKKVDREMLNTISRVMDAVKIIVNQTVDATKLRADVHVNLEKLEQVSGDVHHFSQLQEQIGATLANLSAQVPLIFDKAWQSETETEHRFDTVNNILATIASGIGNMSMKMEIVHKVASKTLITIESNYADTNHALNEILAHSNNSIPYFTDILHNVSSSSNKPLSDLVLAMARDMKQINETTLSYTKDVMEINMEISNSLGRVMDAVKTIVNQTVETAKLRTDVHVNLEKLEQVAGHVHHFSQLQEHIGTTLTNLSAQVPLMFDKAWQSETKTEHRFDTVNNILATIASGIGNMSMKMEIVHKVASKTLITIESNYADTNHTLSKILAYSNNSIPYFTDILHNISAEIQTQISGQVNEMRQIQTLATDASLKLDLIRSEHANAQNSTTTIFKDLITENITGSLSLIINNTEQHARHIKEAKRIFISRLEVIATKLENKTSEMKRSVEDVMQYATTLSKQQEQINKSLGQFANDSSYSTDLLLNTTMDIFNMSSGIYGKLRLKSDGTRRMEAIIADTARKVDVIRTNQIAVDNRTIEMYINITDWLSMVSNKLNETSIIGNVTAKSANLSLDTITNLLKNETAKMDLYRYDSEMMLQNSTKIELNLDRNTNEIKVLTAEVLSELGHIQTNLESQSNVTTHLKFRLNNIVQTLKTEFIYQTGNLTASFGQHSLSFQDNITIMVNDIKNQSETHEMQLHNISDKISIIQGTASAFGNALKAMENRILTMRDEVLHNLASDLTMYQENFQNMSQLHCAMLNDMSMQTAQNKVLIEKITSGVTMGISSLSATMSNLSTSITTTSSTVSNVNFTLYEVIGILVSVNSIVSDVNHTLFAVDNVISSVNRTVSTVNNSLSTIDDTVVSVNNTVSSVNSRLSTVSDTVYFVNSTTSSVNDVVSTMNAAILSKSSSQPSISSTLSDVSSTMSLVSSFVSSINSTLTSVNNSLSSISSTISSVSSTVSSVSSRVSSVSGRTSSISRTVSSISGKLPSCPYHTVRLVSSSGYVGGSSGRVEVCHNGRWGTVCDDSFENIDATVICRMLGYSTGTAKGSAYYGQGSGPIWLDDLSCSSSSVDLFGCRHAGFGVENCSHGEDAGVSCS